MVGLVIVSHSGLIAEGVAQLAREMGGAEVAIEPAGGLEDGSIGTDAERVMAAIGRAASPDGVLVLMDLGSAVMSAEIAVEMFGDEVPVLLSGAPLVEGAVAAAARARGGASLAEVATEARGALRAKEVPGDEDEAAPTVAAAPEPGDALRARVTIALPHGLHVRPAAQVVATATRHDARVAVSNVSRGNGPADAASLTALAMLHARQGDELEFAVSGPAARAALDDLLALAADNFGESLDAAPVPRDMPAPVEPAATDGVLRGAVASRGVAIGPARWLGGEPEVDEVAGADEHTRLDAARDAVREGLSATERDLRGRGRINDADIFAAHLLLLDDSALTGPAAEAIANGASAGVAFRDAGRETAAGFRALDDPYLKQRAVDVEDVARRVLRQLAGAATAKLEPGIVVADELTPGDVAQLDPATAYAIVAARGGITDHASIIAGGLGIPVVVGVGPALLRVQEGATIGVDGDIVELEPDVEAFTRARDEAAQQRERALANAKRQVTVNGRHIDVLANVGSPADARSALANGADGVGLLRTEFLFLDRTDPPTEDEQVAVLTEIAEALEGRRVIVRTLDAGADKPLAFLKQAPEVNPYLGQRGIRLSLAHEDLFTTQLNAIKRVAQRHPIAVMFPMVALPSEVERAKALLGPVDFPVGVMVEVPALALQAATFDVDFFSVGTNDLGQYTMAAERGNPALAPLLQHALAPILQLIAHAVDTGKPVGVCGELAGDPEAARQLVQAGVSSLSMAPSRIPAVKAALSR